MTEAHADYFADWHARMKAAVAAFGSPLYGLEGASRSDGTISQYGPEQIGLTYRLNDVDALEVTTGRQPLGGTQGLVTQLLLQAIPRKLEFPWDLTLTERNAFIPVDGTRTQFHLIEASTGHWMAAGGFLTRHLLLAGTHAFSVDEVSLVPVGLDFGVSFPGESDDARAGQREQS